MKGVRLIAVLSVLVPTPALAATAHAGGPYLMSGISFCPASAGSNGAVKSGGEISQLIGAVTLTPSKTNITSGAMTFSQMNNDGNIVKVNGGGAFASEQRTGSGAYSFSGTTLVVTVAGKSAQTYYALPGLVSSAGVVQDIFAQRIDKNGCSEQLILRSK